jgi:teichuronic acid biosynthesis glycosyltransferase TuaC
MKRLLSIATLYPNAHTPRFGTFVARQLEALAARGDWEVHVINPIGLPPLALGRYAPLKAAAVSGLEHGVHVYRPRFTLIPAVGGPLNPAMIVRSIVPLARKLHAAHPFDLVDAQFFYPDGPAAAAVVADLGLPLSIKARGADISHWGHKPYALRKMRAAAAQASGLLAVSKALGADMAAIGLPQDKITIHYTGLDRARFHPLGRDTSRQQLAQDLAIPTDGPLLASVGALIPRKGQRFVIEALAALPQARAVLVGQGPDRAMLEALATSLGVGPRVHFLGSLDHALLPLVLSASDAMVLPSASEGLANAWVEALACGTPLVITDAGGARELVQSDVAGQIVERDAASLAAGVQAVLAAQLAPEQVAACAAHFSWEANAAALAEYYAGLVGKT